MNDEVAQFDIDEELSVLWQRAYCAVRGEIDGEFVLQDGQLSIKTDKDGQLLFRVGNGAYELAENFDDCIMFDALREVTARRARPTKE